MNKRLSKFLDALNVLNIMSQCNWELEQNKRTKAYVSHYTLTNRTSRDFVNVIFHEYGESKGFSMYVEDQNVKMDASVKMIKDLLNATDND